MGYANYDTVASAWVSNMRFGGTKVPKNERMMPSGGGDELYSYGSHFTLAQALRDKRGDLVAFLVNGDTFSPTTSKHQAATRSAIAGSGVPSVIIPFSALASAGINRSTVRLVDVQPDRNVATLHEFHEMQPSWRWEREPRHAYRDPTPEELQQRLDKRNATARERWEMRAEWAHKECEDKDKPYLWSEYLKPFQPAIVDTLTDSWTDRQITQEVRYVSHHEDVLYTNGFRNTVVDVTETPEGPVYSYETTRHWLGESLIEAEVPYTARRKCKDCGGFGAQPEIFTEYYEGHCRTCGRWQSRGTGRVTVTLRRKAMFLSGFDHNEARNLYHFSELPHRNAATVDEAYEALKPDTVRLAEQMGRIVARQGDIFAIPLLDLDKRTLRKMGARFEKRGQLLGTNHVATEVAYLPGGRTLARGTLTHAPERRRPDHARVTLARNTWHVTVKNTVPIS